MIKPIEEFFGSIFVEVLKRERVGEIRKRGIHRGEISDECRRKTFNMVVGCGAGQLRCTIISQPLASG